MAAENDFLDVNANRSTVILAADLLSNDTDAIGISSVEAGDHGTVSLDLDGNVIFTPYQDYYGPATFSYIVDDGAGGSSAATATLDVRATLDDPTKLSPGYALEGDAGGRVEWDVAQLSDGSHVVTWSDGKTRIWRQRYDASGAPIGNRQGINTPPSTNVSITGLSNGNYVIAYTVDAESTVKFKVFNATGNQQAEVNLFEEGADSSDADIIALQDGGFVVVMSRSVIGQTSGFDVFGQRYDAAGNEVGELMELSGIAYGQERMATGLELPDGRLLMMITNDGTHETIGQVFSSAGYPLSDTFVIRDFVGTNADTDPMYFGLSARPTLLADGRVAIVSGRELAVYDIGSDNVVTEVSRVNLETLDPDGANIVSGDVIALADGGYFTVFNSRSGNTSSPYQVYGQRYDAAGNPVNGVVDFGELVDGQETYVKLEHADDGGVYIYFSNPINSNNAELYKIHVDSGVTGDTLDPAQYRSYSEAAGDELATVANRSVIIAASELLANDGENGGSGYSITSVQNGEHGTVSLDVNGDVIFTPDADYYGPAVFSYTVDDGVGGNSTATVTVDVRATLDDPTKLSPGYPVEGDGKGRVEWDVAQLSDGSQVVTWYDGSYRLWRQRYDASGAPVGNRQAITVGANGSGFNITGLANGNYVITYSVTNGSTGSSVEFEVFNATGNRQAEVSLLEDGVTTSDADIIALQDGGFVLVMSRNVNGETNGQDIFGQRYDASGDEVGELMDLSGLAGGNDGMASGLELPDGRILLTMKNGANETVGQLFSSAGYELSDTFVIRDFVGTNDTTDPMYYGLGAKPALLSDGRVAIVSGRELVVYSIGSDNVITEDSRVNLETLDPDGGNIVSGDVIALADGGYFTVFNSRDGNASSSYQVYGQRYDASGMPVNGVVDFGELVDGQETYVKLEPADGGGVNIYFSNPINSGHAELYKIHVDNGVTGDTLDPAQYRAYSDAAGDELTTVANRSVIIAATELLSNDGENGGTGYSITSVQASEHGTVSLDANGDVIFTPDADYYGPAVFSYTVDDGAGGSSTATVTVDVRATLDDPTSLGSGNIVSGEGNGRVEWDVAQLSDGSQVVTWYDGSSRLWRQRYDTSGAPVGNRQAITVGANGSGFNITGLANGNYVITYSVPNGSTGSSVEFEVFNTTGNRQAEVSLIETGVNFTDADIVALQDGGFVLVMSRQENSVTNGEDTFGQRYDASGNEVGGLFDVSGLAGGNDSMATGLELPDGRLLMMMKNGANETVGQLFSSAGYELSDTFVIRDFVGTNDTMDPMYYGMGAKPTLLSDGRVAIVSGRELVVYSIGSDNVITEDSRVNLETLDPDGGNIVSGDVIALADGGYFTVFNSRDGNASSSYQVYGQRYDASGNPVNGVVDFGELVDGQETYVKLEHADDGGVYVYFSNPINSGHANLYKVHVDSGVTGDTLDPAQYRDFATPAGDELEALANRTVVFSAAELLANDNENGGAGYSLASVQSGEHGSVSLDANGDVVFTPDADYYGPATFSYVVDDGLGGSSTATVTVDVRATLDDPTKLSPGYPVEGDGKGRVEWDVAQLSDGSQVVTWYDGSYRLWRQRYDASGAPVGNRQAITVGANGSGFNITGLANGNYVITYSVTNGSTGSSVEFEVFNATGNRQAEVSLLEDGVTTSDADIIALQDGGFVLVMSRNVNGETNGQDIFGQRYDASGDEVGELMDLSGLAGGNDGMASGLELPDGRILLTMKNGANETVGQLFSSAGYELSDTFVIRDFVGTNDTTDPMYYGLGAKPALLSDGRVAIVSGRELVVYSIGSDNVITEDSRVNLETLDPDGGNIVSGDVIALADGGYFTVFNSRDGNASSSYQVYGQRYDASGMPVNGVVDFGELVDGQETYVKLEPADGGGVNIYFSNPINSGHAELYKIHVDNGVTGDTLDPAQYRAYSDVAGDELTTVANRSVIIAATELLSNDGENGGTGYSITSVQASEHGTVSLDANGDVIFTPDADYYGPAVFSYTVDDGAGGSSTATVTVDVRATLDDPTSLGSGNIVSGEGNGRVEWDVAQLSDGSQVVTWYDGSSRLWRQRYDTSGAPVGNRQAITVGANGSGFNITGLANGNYVITYSVPNGSTGSSVEFEVFNTTGNRQAEVSLIETGVNFTDADIVALQDGGFVLVMSRQENSVTNGEDTFGQRYDASGNEVGGLFDVSGLAGGNDSMATGLELPDGRLLMMMKNGANETVGQLFSSAGYELSDTFVIRDFVGTNDTMDPMYYGMGAKPTLLSDGRVAIVSGRELVVYSIGSDNVITEDSRVNLETLDPDGGNIVSGDVIALADGGYFTVFNSRDGNASSPYQVYGQRYDASGNPVNGVVDFGELVDGQETYVKLEHADDGGVYVYFSNPINSGHANLYKIHVDSGVTGETLDPAQYRDFAPQAGSSGDDIIVGSALDDNISGDAGDDVLTGGSGSDTFVFGRGFDNDSITDAESADTVSLQSDVTANDVWLFQQGDDLVIQLLGSQDSLTVADWYAPAAQQVGEIEVAGSTLDATNVQNLVDAMSVFGINDVAADSLDHNSTEFQNAQAVIAANWQSS